MSPETHEGHPWDEPGFEYRSTTTPETLAGTLAAATSVLILTHQKPDGDALGSCLGLQRGLRQRGVASRILLAGPIDPNLLRIVGPEDRVERVEQAGLPGDDQDLVAILDTGAWTQLAEFGAWLCDQPAPIVGIDHHARGGSVAGERLVETTAASATQVVLTVLDAMDVDIASDGIADALFLGLATDTGWFRFSSAGPEVYRVAARLMEAGARKDEIYALTEQNATPARLAMLSRALGSLRFIGNGMVGVMTLTLEDFAATGANMEELAGIVNQPLDIGALRASVLLTETESGVTKLSLRSKPAEGDHLVVDVNELAATFGGGGHVHAAGARVDGSLAETVARLESVVETMVGR